MLKFVEYKLILKKEDLDIQCSSYNLKNQMISLGSKKGEVFIFDYSDFKLRNKIKLNTDQNIGQVNYIKFSKDGNCLAVGYSEIGLALFDTFMGSCTLKMIPKNSDESPYLKNIQSVTWDYEGYNLFVSESGSKNFNVVNLYKSIVTRNPSQCNVPVVVLQGSDRVVLKNISSENEFNVLKTENLLVSDFYIHDNYPLRHVSMSEDQNNIAVSGKNGISLFDRKKNKWKLFGDKNQETAIQCYGHCWIENDVICLINYDVYYKHFYILLYPKDHLDYKSLIYQDQVTKSKILFISYSNETLYLLDSNNLLYIYQITKKTEGILQNSNVKKLKNISFPQKVPPRLLTSVDTYKLMYLMPDRHLYLYDLKSKNETLLGSNIDGLWFESKYYRGSIYFTYQMGIGVNLHFSNFEKKSLETNLIQYNSDTYPVGILQKKGVFLQASTVTSIKNDFTNFEMMADSISLYNHISLMNNVITNTFVEESVKKHETFQPSLELLLCNTLVDDYNRIYSIEGKEKKKENQVEKVITFIQKYKEISNEIFVNCLRKVDSTLWNEIFKMIGSSKDIFNNCVKSNLLNEAAYMLRVVEQTEGLEYAYQNSLIILEKTMEKKNYSLCFDLSHYINVISQGDRKNEIITNWMYNNYEIQSILLKHLHKIVQQGDIKNIIKFLQTFEFIQFSEWLKSQTIEIKSYEILFESFIKSLGIPKNLKKTQEMKEIQNHQFFTISQEFIYLNTTLLNEIQALSIEFSKLELYDYALLLFTLLCDVNNIKSIISKIKMEDYLKLLSKYQYEMLYQLIKK